MFAYYQRRTLNYARVAQIKYRSLEKKKKESFDKLHDCSRV